MQTLKTIALVDFSDTGHHPTYLKLFTKTLLELGCRVIVFCPLPWRFHEWIACNYPHLATQLHVFEILRPESSSFPLGRFQPTLTTVVRWRYTASVIRQASTKLGSSPDLVFFACLDAYVGPYLTHHVIDRIFPYRWAGLYLHPRHLRAKQRLAAIRVGPLDSLAMLRSSRCLTVAILDEGIAEKLQSRINEKPIVVFPDMTDESPPDSNFAITTKILQKARGRRIIGLLGSLDKRKGLLTLLDVTQKLEQESFFFIFAGNLAKRSFSPEDLERIQAIVETDPHNCYFHFERIPDGPQFNALVNLCDIVFAVYNDFPHSSNLLTKAAVFKKLLLVSNQFCMGERVNQFQLGWSIPENDVSSCTEILRHLCASKLNNQQVRAKFEDYQALHSTERLRAAFQDILQTV